MRKQGLKQLKPLRVAEGRVGAKIGDKALGEQRFPELGKKPVFSRCRAADFGGSALIRCGGLFAVARRETMFYLDEG